MANAAKYSDVYARFQSGNNAGRGSIAGWTPCPLCFSSAAILSDNTTQHETNKTYTNVPSDQAIMSALSIVKQSKSVKLFSHGRGLAAHLHAVHTPWNPGKAELKRRIAARKRLENEERRRQSIKENDEGVCERPMKRTKTANDACEVLITLKRKPSSDEVDRWNARVVEIVKLVEAQSTRIGSQDDKMATTKESKNGEKSTSPKIMHRGTDRLGKICKSYRESLPPFLAAAADGDIDMLRKCIGEFDEDKDGTIKKKMHHINNLISCRDRNGSTAEHWAAGGGHVECLTYILELNHMVKEQMHQMIDGKSVNNVSLDNKRIRRRRDGKTSLHYAARNGHVACIDLIMTQCDVSFPIDVASGDGTTPLHMACYGGHLSTMCHLIEKYIANVHAVNEWSCGAAHWAAMSVGNAGMDAVIEICTYLKEVCGVDFTAKQKQGHTPLHKAAAKKNKAVIEWLAGKRIGCNDLNSRFSEDELKQMGQKDNGGNIPSDIWLSVGGDIEFAQWMKDKCGW